MGYVLLADEGWGPWLKEACASKYLFSNETCILACNQFECSLGSCSTEQV